MNTPTAISLRAQDFFVLWETGALDAYGRSELIDGEILCMNAEYRPHSRIKSWLGQQLRNRLDELHSTYEALTEPSVLLDDSNVPQPDLVVTDDRGAGPIPVATIAMVVEVADATLAQDLGKKMQLYASASIPEYWVVDVNAQIIYQMSKPIDDHYIERSQVAFGGTLISASVPGLRLDTTGIC